LVAGGVNLYRFNNGNPVSFGDPLGLYSDNAAGEDTIQKRSSQLSKACGRTRLIPASISWREPPPLSLQRCRERLRMVGTIPSGGTVVFANHDP
jgi:hypothetical protein